MTNKDYAKPVPKKNVCYCMSPEIIGLVRDKAEACNTSASRMVESILRRGLASKQPDEKPASTPAQK